MNTIFEGVVEVDRGYADIFRRHAETVREQMRTVQTMLQVMQSANKPGTNIKTMIHGMNLQPGISRAERLENLYMADLYGSADTGIIYERIMECYVEYKTEMIFMSYLEGSGITEPAGQQEIYGMIMKKQPSMLRDLYMAVEQSSEDAGAIYNSIMDYYNKHKMDITIEDVEGLDMGERMDQTQKETFVACWNMLGQMGLSKEHIIAVMANIYAESRFSATNAQESYGYIGIYDNYDFETNDGVGYGICQWYLSMDS